MNWVLAGVVVLVVAAVVAVAAGRGGGYPGADHDEVQRGPVGGDLGPEALRSVRFPLAVRGYRMQDVDALLARLADRAEAAAATPRTPAEAPRTPDGAADADEDR